MRFYKTLRVKSYAAFIALSLGSLSSSQLVTVHAQDLKDELNALDDLPEDDLSANAAPKAPKEVPPAAEAGDPLDSLPPSNEATAPEEAPSIDDLPSADELPPDEAEVNVETPTGLEKEVDALKDLPEAAPTEALTGVSNENAAKMQGLDFKQLSDRVRLTIRSDRSIDWTRESRSKRRQVIVELKNTSISRSILKRVLDTGEFDGPVALVQAFDSKIGNIPTVKILFQLRQFVDPTVSRNGNNLWVDFPILTDTTLFRGRSEDQIIVPETVISGNTKVKYVGSKINLNLKDAELSDVLNLISKAAGRNFVLAAGTTAKVTLNVRNIPWDQALSIILLNAKLGYQKLGNIYRIAPIADLKTELAEAADSIKKAEDLIPLETRLFPVNYAKASEVNTSIADFKSARGKSTPDTRTNSLTVTDLPSNLEKIGRYIKTIDRQTSQVLIEARIVEASESFSRSFGIDWKIGESNSAGPQTFKDSFANLGGKGSTFQNGASALRGSDVANTNPNSGGLRLKIGQLGTLGAIQAVLGLAETENKIKTISSPRVMALDNKIATITQSQTIYVSQAATSVTPAGVTPITVPLSLKVTPQVTSDGYVMMHVDLQADTVTPGVGDAPGSPNGRSAVTDMLVKSGKTVVIGGVYTIKDTHAQAGWPGLRSLPLFGVLFQNSNITAKDTVELLMFISPTILNSNKSLLAGAIDDESQSTAKSDLQSESIPSDTF